MEKTVAISSALPVSRQPVEIVERKGLGHPDYICDAVMDRISVALSREYAKRAGVVLHHNIDKGLLVAGQVEKSFGKGRVIRPMELIIGDRAAFSFGKTKVPVVDIARQTVKAWFAENLPHVDAEKHLKTRVVLQPGSVELADIFDRSGRLKGANDTSAACGYAPFTPAEDAVFSTERLINSPAFKLRFPETGEDVKVMGVRRGSELDLTVACPLMAGLIGSEAAYFRRKKEVKEALEKFLSGFPFSKVTLNFNSLDAKGRGVKGVYLSLLGTSAEDADSGQVGRGNRVNGVISLMRPMGTEAAAGKNPVTHVGKIYSVLAHRMAGEVYQRVEGLKEVSVWLVSEIGRPIDEPKQVYAEVVTGARGRKPDKADIERNVSAVVEEFLSGIGPFTEELARGEHPVC
ncbi:S-adenosylmethionine synthetase [uncultured bacterium]|nr:S-adenosylmethionine synthetase [uncultured bacterium]